MFQDAAPAGDDVGAFEQGPLAGMQADHVAARRPQDLHGVGVAFVEGAIESPVGGQDGLAFFVIEFRQERRQAG